jgi:1,4-alpha-glucan branching enzyme
LLIQTVSSDEIARVVNFEESDPHAILGPKKATAGGREVVSVRAFFPRARRAWLRLEDGKTLAMSRLSDSGFFEGQFEVDQGYLLGSEDKDGYAEEREDPYSFGPLLTDYDLHLMGEGKYYRSYEALGAHPRNLRGVDGVSFAVWAPNAHTVALVGDFNHWNVGEHPMLSRGASGVWELFVPRLSPGEKYKYAVRSRATGRTTQKADPYAFRMEVRPRTASIATDLGRHEWSDAEWLRRRKDESPLDRPLSVYEVHIGSWRRGPGGRPLSYEQLGAELVPYLKEMGFTHVELLPVMEHPLDESWGYQVANYFAPTSRYGSPEALMGFVDLCHRNGIGVILDWVPAHFPKDEYGLGSFDGTHLYEHEDPRLGEHPDWGTYIFNYGRNEVKSFLVSNALFWVDKYHADGLRIDAVASMLYLDYSRKEGAWVPNRYGGRENLEAIALLREVSGAVHGAYPNVLLIAEESTSWPGVTKPTDAGGLGFDLKWNMGWMHDTLGYFSKDPAYRKYHHDQLTFSLWYAFSERFILVLSHDEVVHGKGSMYGKMPGDDWQKFANLRLCYGYMFAHPGKKLLFMGNELGERREWDAGGSLDWSEDGPLRAGLRRFVKDLNMVYRSEGALHELDFTPDGFEWIDFQDQDNSVVSFLRKSKDGRVVVGVCNMTPVPRTRYRIGVPREGRYNEILNSDAEPYGGSGLGNLGGVDSEAVEMHGRRNSVALTLPPLSLLLLKHSGVPGP